MFLHCCSHVTIPGDHFIHVLLEVQAGHSHYSLLKETYYGVVNGGGTKWFTSEYTRRITHEHPTMPEEDDMFECIAPDIARDNFICRKWSPLVWFVLQVHS